MKGIKKFVHTHKKGCIIGGCIFLAVLLISFTMVFIIPAFGDNNYGHRLDDSEKHEISNNTINSIKDEIKGKDGVTKVTYHKEGRILNFTITVGDVALDKSKEYAKAIIEGISKKNLKYYDVQVFLTTKEKSNIYPVAGYKHKTSDEFIWGNVGESSE